MQRDMPVGQKDLTDTHATVFIWEPTSVAIAEIGVALRSWEQSKAKTCFLRHTKLGSKSTIANIAIVWLANQLSECGSRVEREDFVRKMLGKLDRKVLRKASDDLLQAVKAAQ